MRILMHIWRVFWILTRFNTFNFLHQTPLSASFEVSFIDSFLFLNSKIFEVIQLALSEYTNYAENFTEKKLIQLNLDFQKRKTLRNDKDGSGPQKRFQQKPNGIRWVENEKKNILKEKFRARKLRFCIDVPLESTHILLSFTEICT